MVELLVKKYNIDENNEHENTYVNISDISYLKTILPATVEEEFYNFLQEIDTSKVTLSSLMEGSLVFPRVPLIRIEGPLPGTYM